MTRERHERINEIQNASLKDVCLHMWGQQGEEMEEVVYLSHHFSSFAEATTEFLCGSQHAEQQSPLGSLVAVLCTIEANRASFFSVSHQIQPVTVTFHRIFLHIGPDIQ